jgi:hypothetical protein
MEAKEGSQVVGEPKSRPEAFAGVVDHADPPDEPILPPMRQILLAPKIDL